MAAKNLSQGGFEPPASRFGVPQRDDLTTNRQGRDTVSRPWGQTCGAAPLAGNRRIGSQSDFIRDVQYSERIAPVVDDKKIATTCQSHLHKSGPVERHQLLVQMVMHTSHLSFHPPSSSLQP